MSKGAISKKNKEMAAYLKVIGLKRDYCNCAICHHRVGLSGYESHLKFCKGRRRVIKGKEIG